LHVFYFKLNKIKNMKEFNMNKKATASVIIPTYNRAHLVGRAIQSVLNQTYQDFELIIVDDASTDNTEDVIKEFQQKDNRIIYLKHDQNKGGSAARNTGIKISKGKYIAFLDSDDEWFPEKLEKQMNYIQSSNYGFMYCNMIINDKTNNTKKNLKIDFKDDIFIDLLKNGSGICTSALLVKQSLLEKVGGFDESLPSYQDYDFLLRLSQKAKCGFLDEILLFYNLDENGISKTAPGKMEGRIKILSKYFKYYIELDLKKYYSKHCYGVAGHALLCGDKKTVLKYCKESILYNPLYIKSYFEYFIVSVFGIENFLKIREIKNTVNNKGENNRNS